jgi:hypothetical protein
MDQALVALSRKGQFKEVIKARDIPSREHARKLWPLVTPEPPFELVTYVRPSFDADGKLLRRSHFSRLPKNKRQSVAKQFEAEEKEWHRVVSESKEHRQAKELLAQELVRLMKNEEPVLWCFADRQRSDFPFKGNLLLGANQIETEFPIKTPLGKEYRLDVAVLGPPIKTERMLLAGIEIELGHAFDGYKGLISKTLGFPLISVDITDMQLHDITAQWASNALQATTLDHVQGLRKTFIYLHDLVYPQFVCFPEWLNKEQRHQYLIFAHDSELNQLEKWVKELARCLNYTKQEVAVAKVHAVSEQARLQLERAGFVVGSDWAAVNDHQCLRITVDRPKSIDDVRAHRFHTTLARLLLSEVNALVGYKYCTGINNDDPEEDLWHHHRWLGPETEPEVSRVLPKRLAEPMSRILSLVEQLKNSTTD